MNRETAAPSRTSRLRELDALRGLAAMGVVFWHYRGHFHAQPLASLFAPLYQSGYYAVDFFFVLSGMVLARAYATEIRGPRFAENIVKRIARMFPLHLATLLIVAAGQFVLVDMLHARRFVVPNNDLYHFVLNLGFAHYVGLQSGFSFNAPSWSISTEFWINVVFFACLAVSRRRLVPISVLIVVAAFATVVLTGNGSLAMANTIRYPGITLVRTALGFFCGVVLHEVFFQRLERQRASPILYDLGFLLTVGALLAGALGRLQIHPHIEMATVVVGFPLLIVCASRGALAKRALQVRPLRYLGDISYSVYLIHFPVQLALHMLVVAGWVALPFDSAWVLLLFIAVTLGLASASYRFLELPGQDAINRWWRAGHG